MSLIDTTNIKYDILEDDLLDQKDVSITVKRLDLLHPYVSGNKWFKLKYNLSAAKAAGAGTIITFGGAYSNHIVATAVAARSAGFKSIGIIRGEAPKDWNPLLKYAHSQGMQLEFISREEYRFKNEEAYQKRLLEKFNNSYIIPEGGANEEGVKGAMEILNDDDKDFDFICCACGTATTFAGMVMSAGSQSKLLGFSVLKGLDFSEELKAYFEWFGKSAKEFENYKIITDYHFGGYAKKHAVLIDFIDSFMKRFNIPIEPVYTGKLFYGIFDMVEKECFLPGSRVLVIHCGGVFGEVG